MADKKPVHPYVKISQAPKKQIKIEWGFITYFRDPSEKENKFSCYIPAFNIFFSVKDKENMGKKSLALVNMYIDHFLIHSGKNGIKNLVLELHKLGFKANNDNYTIYQLISNKPMNAKFKSISTSIPNTFDKANQISQKSKLAVAL